MELTKAVRLIEKGIETSPRQRWADLGAGAGLFTEALLTLLPDGSHIHAIDRDISQFITVGKFASAIKLHQLDLTRDPLPVDNLDGVLMANTLHFIRDQVSFLISLKNRLRVHGRIIIVEYDIDRPNQWVPFPVSMQQLGRLAVNAGFNECKKLDETDSRYHRSMYSALITA